MTIKPLADRVVIKLVEAEEKTKTGITLPATAQENPKKAEVFAEGPGKPGAAGVEYTIISEKDVLAVIE